MLRLRFFPKRKALNERIAALISPGTHTRPAEGAASPAVLAPNERPALSPAPSLNCPLIQPQAPPGASFSRSEPAFSQSPHHLAEPISSQNPSLLCTSCSLRGLLSLSPPSPSPSLSSLFPSLLSPLTLWLPLSSAYCSHHPSPNPYPNHPNLHLPSHLHQKSLLGPDTPSSLNSSHLTPGRINTPAPPCPWLCSSL